MAHTISLSSCGKKNEHCRVHKACAQHLSFTKQFRSETRSQAFQVSQVQFLILNIEMSINKSKRTSLFSLCLEKDPVLFFILSNCHTGNSTISPFLFSSLGFFDCMEHGHIFMHKILIHVEPSTRDVTCMIFASSPFRMLTVHFALFAILQHLMFPLCVDNAW